MNIENGTLHTEFESFDYVRFGRGMDLVMIPGLGDGLTTVGGKAFLGNIMFSDYARNYRVTIISRQNEMKEGETTLSMADDEARAFGVLGIKKAHIVGISQGGMIAQHFAAKYPHLVDKLVLVVTVPKSNELIIKNAGEWLSMAGNKDYEAIMKSILEKAHPPKYLRKLELFYPFITRVGKPKDFKRFIIQCHACMTHDAEAVLDKIEAPTLIIGGKKDETLGYEGSIELAKSIKNSEVFIYPEMGHALYEDAKDFNKRVLSFLEE